MKKNPTTLKIIPKRKNNTASNEEHNIHSNFSLPSDNTSNST